MPAAADTAPFTDDEIETLFATLGPPGGPARVLAAVSGGSDSLGLLHLLQRWRERRADRGEDAPALAVATVDHGLRPESSAEARDVGALCARLGLDHVVLTWRGDKPVSGVQAAAREARYALLFAEAARRGASHVVTAHTLDDQAETVLMRLARGSGLKGLGGMARESPRAGLILVRPLLAISRLRLRAALIAAGIAWVEDPSNADSSYLRPRLRALLPALAAEGLTAERFAAVARKLRRADEAIDAEVRRFLAEHARAEAGRMVIALAPLCERPLETRMRILARALAGIGDAADPIGDEPLERLATEIALARSTGEALRRTLGGALVSLGQTDIRITAEPPRRDRRP